MNEELIQIFAECTEAIEQGRLTVDDCLDKYPQYRAELIDLLLAAMQARAVPTATPAAEFRLGARARLLAHLPPRAAADGAVAPHQLIATTAVTQRLQTTWQMLVQRWPWPVRPPLAIGVALLLVFLFFIGTWLRQSSEETELAQDNLPAQTETTFPEEETEVTAPETPPTSDAVAEDSQEEIAAATPDDTFSTYIPVVSNPLVLNTRTAAVEVSQGVVEIQNEAGAWTAVNRVATATAGQRVRTSAFSGATLTFYDGSQATLGPNTELSLDQVDAQLPEEGFRTVVMTQWVGESEHDVAFRNDSGSRYEVMTPNGSGRARGTTFQVLVTATNLLTQVIVTEGRVDVTNLNVTVIVIAGQTSLIPPQQPPGQPHFIVSGEGEVTVLGETWTIGGQTFTTTDNTIIVGNPQIGDIVSVSGYLLPDGTLVATHIVLRHRAPANRFTLTGEVVSIGADEWVVAGQSIAVNEETAVDETIVVGDIARVHGLILADGTLLAERIDRVDDVHPFEFIGVVQSIGPDSWLISGVDITLNENTEIKDDIAVGDVVKVEGVILADDTWLAGEIKLADDEAKFEFSGPVNSIDPWLVAGIPFETDTFTEIDSGIVVGDLVYVEGQILADGTWLAPEIRLLADEALTFTFIGTVNSLDPWIVSGIPMEVDENTLIDDEVKVGALVRVRGLILPNGDWLATLIVRLDHDDAPIGCYTLTTMVVSISGNQVTLEGLPPITLNDGIIIEGDILPNTIITVTVCVGHDGTIIIISIVVIHTVPPPPPPPPPAPTALPGGSPPPSGGGAFDITGNNENLTLNCNGHTVTVRGNDNTITLLGSCGSIVARGNSNTIFYQAAASITNTGNNNTIQQR